MFSIILKRYSFIVKLILLSCLGIVLYFYNVPVLLFINAKQNTSFMSNIMLFMTILADASIAISIMCIVHFYKKEYWLPTLLALIVAGLVTQSMKELFHVERPAYQLGTQQVVVVGRFLQTYTFPSGHATTAIVATCYYAFGVKNHIVRYTLVLLGLIEATSRVYLGVHFPFDVFVGGVIGLIFIKIFYTLFQRNKTAIRINMFINTKLSFVPILLGLLTFILYITLNDYRHSQFDTYLYIFPAVLLYQLFIKIKLKFQGTTIT